MYFILTFASMGSLNMYFYTSVSLCGLLFGAFPLAMGEAKAGSSSLP